MNRLDKLLADLNDLKIGKISNPATGICKNCHGNSILVEKATYHWPKYSGDYKYPVPPNGILPTQDAEDAYETSYWSKTLWDKDTVYAQLRYELVDFLIEYFNDCETYVVTDMGATVYSEFDFDSHKDDSHIFVIVKESLEPSEGFEEALSDLYFNRYEKWNLPFVVLISA
jgi:hypothetical protein